MLYETVIGLEVHAQLSTYTKIFSGSATTFGAEPNTQASLIDLGMPGVLPVLNEEVVRLAIKFGLSIDATINQASVFARKNYFYPDLPKGYQISQFDQPIVIGGHIDIETPRGNKRIDITRAHLEEDAGKSLHDFQPGLSGIDLNRAGTPLLEIVSEPDFRSAQEVLAYLKKLHQIVRYLEVGDGNMQEGSFRCDVNISLRPFGQTEFGTRAEIKNLNSFRFIEQAIAYEIDRQSDILDQGDKVVQETRLFDPKRGITQSMRKKEEAHDYRYFPDPDLLPVIISDEEIQSIKAELPELPAAKQQRYQEALGLNREDALQLTQSRRFAHFFEATLQQVTTAKTKLVANWMLGEVKAYLNQQQINMSQLPLSTAQFAKLLDRIADNTLSSSGAKTVFATLCEGQDNVDAIIEQQGLKQMNDASELEAIIKKIIADNPSQAEDYRAGKEKLLTFFVGQTMKATRGKANPKQVNSLIKEHLN